MEKDEKEFKRTLSELSHKEKDRLIWRLLRKDWYLREQLHFNMVDTRGVEELREECAELVKDKVEKLGYKGAYMAQMQRFIRYVSGDISHHVRITKDKYGEIELNLVMLNELLREHQVFIINSDSEKYKRKLFLYVVNRIFRTMGQLQKIHEDLRLDFSEAFERLGTNIQDIPELNELADENGLEIHWLTEFEIPENIAQVYKGLKLQGLLK